jgi:hypothetical protein
MCCCYKATCLARLFSEHAAQRLSRRLGGFYVKLSRAIRHGPQLFKSMGVIHAALAKILSPDIAI